LKGHRKFDAYEPTSATSQGCLVIRATYLLEIGTSRDDLMNEIFHREDVIFSKSLFDHSIVGKRDPLLVDLPISALVDKFANGFQIRLSSCSDESLSLLDGSGQNRLSPICNVRFNKAEHLLRRSCRLDKDAIVDLEEPEKLHYFSGFGCNLIDTV
jgi:hypothetical protein